LFGRERAEDLGGRNLDRRHRDYHP
jgi:hypothetical protein